MKSYQLRDILAIILSMILHVYESNKVLQTEMLFSEFSLSQQ